MEEIKFDFCAAGQAMHQMEEVTERMNTEVLPGFEEVMQEIAECWNGEAGAGFQELMRCEEARMKRSARILNDTDTCIRDAILTAKRVEEKTKEIAKLRTY